MKPGNALVIGASSGIGEATAQLLEKRGYRVYGTSRYWPDPTVQASFSMLGCDVTQDASVRETVRAVCEREGSLDAVINCAGFGLCGALEEVSGDDLRAQFEVNVIGTQRLLQAVLPVMRRQHKGHFLVVSSIAGRVGLPFQGPYCASKFALEGLIESLQMEVNQEGIHVTLIEPGNVDTPFTEKRIVAREPDSPYGERLDAALSVIEADERGGVSAAHVAQHIMSILERRHPPMRSVVGPLAERAALPLQALLPARLFAAGLAHHYKRLRH